MSNVRLVRRQSLQKINRWLNFRAWHGSQLIRQDHIWPPVLGEIQAKVMCCSEASADTSSLNHQDPFIHPYGSQLTANKLPAKWTWCPDSRLLRQVGLTVGLADPDSGTHAWRISYGRVSSCTLKSASCKSECASCKLKTASCKLKSASCKWERASYKLKSASCKS